MSTYGHIPTAWPCETLVYSEYLTLLMSDLIILFQRQIQWVLFTVLSISNSSLCLCWQSEHTHLSDPTRDRWREMKSRVSVSLCLLPASLAPPSALTRPKPYQGVRVRDPVKELLRRKRSLELHSAKTAPPTVVRTPWYATLTCMLDDITFFLQ